MCLLANRASRALFKQNWDSFRYVLYTSQLSLSVSKRQFQSPTSTTTYKRDGKLHKFILELDYAFYAFADPTLALRLYGQVFSGAARTTYPPFESAPDSRPGSPGTQYVYTLFAANRKHINRTDINDAHIPFSTSHTTRKSPSPAIWSMVPRTAQV